MKRTHWMEYARYRFLAYGLLLGGSAAVLLGLGGCNAGRALGSFVSAVGMDIEAAADGLQSARPIE